MDWPPATPGPRRCTCASLTHIITEQQIDLDFWQEALRLTVHHEPHLRTDVDLGVDPPVWIPATDFTQVFTFRDLREQAEGTGGVDGVWQLLEEQANHPWDYGAGAASNPGFFFAKHFQASPSTGTFCGGWQVVISQCTATTTHPGMAALGCSP